jgi:hypothetical protein
MSDDPSVESRSAGLVEDDLTDATEPIEPKPLSEQIISGLAEAKGADPLEIDPLYETVDVDALNDLFAPKMDGTPRKVGSIMLEHDGFVVTVRDDGDVDVRSSAD